MPPNPAYVPNNVTLVNATGSSTLVAQADNGDGFASVYSKTSAVVVSSSSYVGINAEAPIQISTGAVFQYSLPISAPAENQVLVSDVAGALTFQDLPSLSGYVQNPMTSTLDAGTYAINDLSQLQLNGSSVNSISIAPNTEFNVLSFTGGAGYTFDSNVGAQRLSVTDMSYAAQLNIDCKGTDNCPRISVVSPQTKIEISGELDALNGIVVPKGASILAPNFNITDDAGDTKALIQLDNTVNPSISAVNGATQISLIADVVSASTLFTTPEVDTQDFKLVDDALPANTILELRKNLDSNPFFQTLTKPAIFSDNVQATNFISTNYNLETLGAFVANLNTVLLNLTGIDSTPAP